MSSYVDHSAYLQHFVRNFFFSVSTFDLGENQKRWVVIGICLNKLLLPILRNFVGQEIPKHYTSLKGKYGIDTQVYGRHMTHDRTFQLNYGSINNNSANFKKKLRSYDYKVGTAEDLAKLYLEPHMAKFTGTDYLNGFKTENVYFSYRFPWKHIFIHYTHVQFRENQIALWDLQSTVSDRHL